MMNQWIFKFALYAALLIGSVAATVVLPLGAASGIGGHHANKEFSELKEKRGIKHIDLEDPEVKTIFEKSDLIKANEMHKVANLGAIVAGVTLLIVGFLFKGCSYLDMFIISLPIMFSYLMGVTQAIPFIVAMLFAFSSIYVREKLRGQKKAQSNAL